MVVAYTGHHCYGLLVLGRDESKMSQETQKWLNENVLVGFTDQRGLAWHHEEGTDNHYPGAIPVGDVQRRLFNWEALEADVLFENANTGKIQGARDAKIIYRSDTGADLGIHSQGWQCHGYTPWLLDNVANILDSSLQIGSAGLLKGGAIAFVQVETPDTIEGPNGETYRPFIAATTSMNGTIATTYKEGVTRIVCDNTRSAFFASKGRQYKVRHTAYSQARIADAREALGLMFSVAEDYKTEMDQLMGQSVTDAQWTQFVESYVPIDDQAGKRGQTMAKNKRQGLSELWFNDLRVTPWAGTAWGALQAISTYQQHERSVQNMTRVERNWLNFLGSRQANEETEAMEALAKVLA